MIENVGLELKKYFQGKSYLASLLGFDMIILYGCVALSLLGLFVYLGGFIGAILTYLFLLGVVLALANLNFNALMIGLGARAATALISFFIVLFSGYGFNWSALFMLIVYGFFAYMAYNKTIKRA